MAVKRVLVIDDNAVNRRLVQVLLHSRGYEVWEATSCTGGLCDPEGRRPDSSSWTFNCRRWTG